jgi:hypothetical protein
MFDRGDYWQCAYVIPKGGFERVQARGLEAFQRSVAAIVPFLSDRVEEIRHWSDVKLLTVAVDRLRQWHRPGLLCIGDAAHAMFSDRRRRHQPRGAGCGCRGEHLEPPAGPRRVRDSDLARVQKRREFPTRVVQRVQLLAQDLFLKRTLEGRVPRKMRWPSDFCSDSDAATHPARAGLGLVYGRNTSKV